MKASNDKKLRAINKIFAIGVVLMGVLLWFGVSQANAAPISNFILSWEGEEAPLMVSLLDQSIGEVTSWSWDFGDGSTSALKNPGHIYINAGTNSISLTVTGPSGSDTETKVDCITVELSTSDTL